MAILGLQQQQTEVGRIRLGVKVKTGRGKEHPAKLDRLRFTSPRRQLVDAIAAAYGGTVEPWQPPRGNQQWQVITNVTEVPVLVPPQDPGQSQWLEMWSKGGCQRRCDGETETISRQACLCAAELLPPEDRCRLHTRLRVMLEDIPGLGAWRVDTGSYYAAVELPGIAQLLAMAQGAIPGRLVLDQRTVTRNGKTMNFVVPTLHVDEITPRQLVSGEVQKVIAAQRASAIEGTARAALTSGVDYESLIGAAQTVDALKQLHADATAAGAVDEDLKAMFADRAAEIRAADTSKSSTRPPVEQALDGEIVVDPSGSWPATPAIPDGAA